MRNLKKILALVLALMMALSVMVFASARNLEDYTDAAEVSEDYAEAVDVLTGMGIFEGDEEGFRPQDHITRAEVATLVYRVLTGDVNNVNVGLYEDYGYFTDVPADEWYAGYVNFVANGKHVVGVADGIYDPDANVTGYQMLTIMLRAIGYGQKEEFEGDSWTIYVAQYAESLGLTNGLNTTLSAQLTREEVAYIIWQAIRENMVEWTPAFGYQPIWIEADDNNVVQLTTTTLGWEEFGLAPYAGYVVGNQVTGEDGTLVHTWYTSASANDVTLDAETDLTLFGHRVSGYYCAEDTTYTDEGTTYSMNDLSTSVVMTQSELQDAITDNEVNIIAHSDAFDDFASNSVGNPAFTAGDAWDYNVVVSTGNDDVVIKLWIETAQYTARNDYTTTKTVTLYNQTDNYTKTLPQAEVSGFENLALGTFVNVVKVVGTNGVENEANSGYEHYYVSALDTTTGTLSYVNALTDAITIGGSVIDKAPANQVTIAEGAGVPDAPATNAWSWNSTYVVYTNLFGDFVGAAVPSNDSYAKLTYAYYETVPSTGEHTYHGKIVRVNGQVEDVVLDITQAQYMALNCSKLEWSTDVVSNGNPLDVVLTAGTDGYEIAHINNTHGTGDCPQNDCWAYWDVVHKVGMTTVQEHVGGAWTVSDDTVSLGWNSNYFVDETTRFVVIGGTDGVPTTTTYTGVAALLQGNETAVIPADSVISSTRIYSANIGTQNYHVDYVLIEDVDLVPASTLVYVPTATRLGYNTVGENAYPVYDVYVDGVAYQVPVNATGVTLTAETFYTYTVDNGVYVLAAATAADGAVENYVMDETDAEGNAYLYVFDGTTQRRVAADAGIINLETTVENVPTTTADLIEALENNNVTVDAEVVGGTVVNLYITNYTLK